MATPPLSDELAQQAVDAYTQAGNHKDAAASIGLNYQTFRSRLNIAAARGLLGTSPVLPGFSISKTTSVIGPDGETQREFIQQKPEAGEAFEVPGGHAIKGVSALVGADGRILQQWLKTREQPFDQVAAVKAAIEECKSDLVPVKPTKGPDFVNGLLLNQYTLTDLHFGMLAWAEETGDSDYDLGIAEQLLLDWFSAAIATSPKAHTAVLAQLGDLMHHDSLESVTPEHRNILDADSRLQKVIRVVIRVVRQVIAMLLQTHEQVHVIMAAGNHDPASSAWLRELLAALYEDEPRLTVDRSPSVYIAYEWGRTALFYHHGDKRKLASVDTVFAGKFREIFGRCPHAYGHIGHLHNDEIKESNLMKVERHRTLAAPDAYAANGGWLAGRDAKVITYHREFGEVSRQTLSPQMVMKS